MSATEAKQCVQKLRQYFEENDLMNCFIRNPLNEAEEIIDQMIRDQQEDPKQRKITEFFQVINTSEEN